MTREEMLRRMSGRELIAWQTFARVCGLGDGLEFMAVLCSMAGSALGGKVKPGDVAGYFAVAPSRSPEDMLAVFSAAAARHNEKA